MGVLVGHWKMKRDGSSVGTREMGFQSAIISEELFRSSSRFSWLEKRSVLCLIISAFVFV